MRIARRRAQVRVKQAALAAATLLVATGDAQQLVGIHFDTGRLYRISTADGSTTASFNTGIVNPGCLALAPDGNYYSFSCGANSQLYKVDVFSGNKTLVGALGVPFMYEGGMAFDNNGNAYATQSIEAENPQLLKINLSTGAATVAGRIGATNAYDINGLVWDDSTNLLVGIDREHNQADYIGPTGGVGLGPVYDPTSGGPNLGEVGDMCQIKFAGFTLATYFVTGGPDPAIPGDNSLWSMNMNTLAATRIGALTGITGTGLSGLAPVPEPSTILIVFSGIAFLAARSRRGGKQ